MMKKVFTLVSMVLAFGLMGCGTSSCDDEDTAKQALDILLQQSGISAKELGARAVNIIMLDKEKNVCQADIWLQPVSEIGQEMSKDYIAEMIKENPLIYTAIVEQFASLQALRLMGYKVKLRSNDLSLVTQDGKKFDFFESLPKGEQILELSRFTNMRKLLNELASVSMHYQVTSSDKGEYILAEPVKSSGNSLYENDKKSKVELVEIVQATSEPVPAPQTQSESAVKPEIQSQNESVEPKQEVQSETQIPSPAPQENATNEPSPQTESATNSSQDSVAPSPVPSVSDKLPSIRLATKDDYVNLRKAPSGEILTPIYKKDFDKITIKKLDGGNDKWLKVLYFPPNETDESKAVTGYIHNSQIAK